MEAPRTSPGSEPGAPGAGYFPDGTLTAWEVESYVGHLHAMDEPSLLPLQRQLFSHAYRFLWLRSFDDPIAVRVELRPDRTARLVAKVLRRSDEGVRVVTADVRRPEVEALLHLLAQTRFWALPTHAPEIDPGSGMMAIKFDGSNWILEGTWGGRYHVVDRWSGDMSAGYRAACLAMLDLSGVQIRPEEIY